MCVEEVVAVLGGIIFLEWYAKVQKFKGLREASAADLSGCKADPSQHFGLANINDIVSFIIINHTKSTSFLSSVVERGIAVSCKLS